MRAHRERVGSITWLVLTSKPGCLAGDLATALSGSPREILVDFTHCRSVGSLDARSLCRHLWRARQRGARIVLGAITGSHVRFIKTSGLADYFPWEDNLPDAVSHFKEKSDRLLGQMLISSGRLDEAELEDALSVQAQGPPGRRLGEILVEKRLIESSTLLRILFRQKIDGIAA